MLKKTFFILVLFTVLFQVKAFSQIVQTNDSIQQQKATDSVDVNPIINYTATPKSYIIADIKVTGLENSMYEDFVLIGFSGLSKGQEILVPGDEITNAVQRLGPRFVFRHQNSC